jgi:hypothetical protein
LTNKTTNGETEDELMMAIEIELDQIVDKEVCDVVYEAESKKPDGKSPVQLNEECKNRKDKIIGVISSSVYLERLYFIIRSSVMGIITGLLTYGIISIFKITNFFELVLLGIITFVISLVISRIFDGPIVKVCNLILRYLNRYQRLREFILNRL